MSLLVVGCNHRSADLPLLERLAVPTEELPKVLASLLRLPHVTEAAILSTCSRVEIYASVTKFHPGLAEVRGWLADRGDVHPQDLEELHYSYHDDRAAAHLFAVAGGVDSMVVGEQQVAGQVRAAMELARAEGAARRVLLRLFRQAISAGRRIRRETSITAGASSIVDVGLDIARARLGSPDLSGRSVLILGAGKVGALTAQRLVGERPAAVLVWNRNADKAERLARRFVEAAPGRAVTAEVVPAHELPSALGRADLVVCTTGAAQPILDADLVARARAHRGGASVVLLDLGMPRNVDPACARLAGVHRVDIVDVRDRADRGVTGDVLAAARRIVDDEAEQFAAWIAANEVEPTIRDLRARAEQVRRSELRRLSGRLGALDDQQRSVVEALTRGIVNTLLHDPTIRLKDLADAGGAEPHADALRELFGLDEEGPGRQPASDGPAGDPPKS